MHNGTRNVKVFTSCTHNRHTINPVFCDQRNGHLTSSTIRLSSPSKEIELCLNSCANTVPTVSTISANSKHAFCYNHVSYSILFCLSFICCTNLSIKFLWRPFSYTRCFNPSHLQESSAIWRLSCKWVFCPTYSSAV